MGIFGLKIYPLATLLGPHFGRFFVTNSSGNPGLLLFPSYRWPPYVTAEENLHFTLWLATIIHFFASDSWRSKIFFCGEHIIKIFR
jgi:hypothetical protein